MIRQIIKKIIVSILLWEAKLVISKYKPRVIAITGSVGKTSTKDAIYSVLSNFYFIRKSTKSFNSEIGVPLAILGCPNAWNDPIAWLKNILEGLLLICLPNRYPEWLVLEVGVDKPGDMDLITSWLKPDVVVVTRLSKVPVHVEFFPSPEAVFHEKGKLVRAVKPDGVVILNADDEDVIAFRNLTSSKTMLFSAGGSSGGLIGPDLNASDYSVFYETEDDVEVPAGIRFSVRFGDKSVPVEIRGSLGAHYINTGLAALLVGLSQGLDLDKLAVALSQVDRAPGRMKILSGTKKTTLIDDSYNSSPVALSAALDALAAVKTKRRIAVLGDMLELGKYSVDEHKKAGAHAAKCAQMLVTVGVRARSFAEGALENGMKEAKITRCEDSRNAAEFLKNTVKKGDVILIKGSQSMRMERVTAALLSEPHKAGRLLVRQEDEWLKR